MEEIQKDYLIGLVLKKVHTFKEDSIQELNVNSTKFNESIEEFISKCSINTKIPSEILTFLNSGENNTTIGDLKIIKDDNKITTSFNESVFTLLKTDYLILIKTILGYFADYLPIGSVIKIFNNDKPLIIEQRMVRPKGEDYYIDYRAIPYPMGIFNESMYVYFSIKDIEKVLFTGYSDSENEGYELALKESLIDNNIFEKEDELKN